MNNISYDETGIFMIAKYFYLILISILASINTANAALIDRGNGLIYDEFLNVTWLYDANFSKTTGYDSDGLMNWYEASEWASNLVYRGATDWRLPKSDSCSGKNCIGSEMGFLFYKNFSVEHPNSVLSSESPNFYLFKNFQGSNYWSGTIYDYYPAEAYFFEYSVGNQNVSNRQLNYMYALAVHDGDILNVREVSSVYVFLVGFSFVLFLGLRVRNT